MRHNSAPQHDQHDGAAAIPFATLLYRYLFFDWLFADMSKAGNLFERHCAWQHNRAMRIHLPLYLWRWSVLSALDFGLGCLFERLLGTPLLAAWCFIWSCVALAGMTVISVLWVFLSNGRRS